MKTLPFLVLKCLFTKNLYMLFINGRFFSLSSIKKVTAALWALTRMSLWLFNCATVSENIALTKFSNIT